MSLTSLSGVEKDNLVVSLASIIASESGAEITAETLQAIVDASGNSVAPYWAPLFATFAAKADGLDKFFGAPGAGKFGPSYCHTAM